MRKLLGLVLALLVTVGCDDPTVHEYITTNFVCVYRPSWMGECDSSELTARAQNVLDHGLVQAQIKCEGSTLAFKYLSTAHNTDFKYQVELLQDGSCFSRFSVIPSGTTSFSKSGLEYYDRTSATATGCEQVAAGYSGSYADGVLTITSPELSTGSPTCPYSPETYRQCDTPDTELDIESVCTGFNLEAFGVE